MSSGETVNREPILINAKELFGDFSEPGKSPDIKNGFEKCFEWPGEIGNGFMTNMELRPGMVLEIGNYRLRKNIAISFEQAHHSVSLVFNVSGSIKRTLGPEKVPGEYWRHTQGHSVMGYLPKHRQSIIKPLAGSRAYYVHIAIDPLLLKTLLDGDHDRMPIGLHDIVNGAEEQGFYQTSVMPPVIHTAIHQLIGCPYRSSLKRLFLEGKVLELISHSMARFASRAGTPQNDADLRPDDLERVLEARNILIRNLDNPPSLLALARQVGTNKTTLNKGFRQIFGTSAFDYLRIRRLERARELLDSKKMTVSEAAFRVGYTHQSSFARAFKNHFGAIPTDRLH